MDESQSHSSYWAKWTWTRQLMGLGPNHITMMKYKNSEMKARSALEKGLCVGIGL